MNIIMLALTFAYFEITADDINIFENTEVH